MEAVAEERECEEVKSWALNDENILEETSGWITWHFNSVVISKGYLEIVDDVFAGDEEGHWAVGFSWKLNIPELELDVDYFIADLPVGSISIFVNADSEGTIYYHIDGEEPLELPDKVEDVNEWTWIQISSNSVQVTGIVIPKYGTEGSAFSVEYGTNEDAVNKVRLRGDADKSDEVSSQFGYLKAYFGFLTQDEVTECMTPTFPDDDSCWAPKVTILEMPLTEPSEDSEMELWGGRIDGDL